MATLIYVNGDKDRVPVDPGTQPQGTGLVLVSARGRDVHFIVGKQQTNDPAKVLDRFAKTRLHPDREG